MKEIDDEEVEQFIRDVVRSLPEHLRMKLQYADKDALSKREAENLFARVMLGAMESPVFFKRWAREVLAKPMAVNKLQTALIPKNVHIEETKKVQHTIVVPEMQTVAQWMQARNIAGTTQDELGFDHMTVEVEDGDPEH